MERNPRFVGTTYLVGEIERYAPKIVTRRNDNDKVRDGKNGGEGRGKILHLSGRERGEDGKGRDMAREFSVCDGQIFQPVFPVQVIQKSPL